MATTITMMMADFHKFKVHPKQTYKAITINKTILWLSSEASEIAFIITIS